jgi:tetratricopeptide (TPR) repeat protein
VALFAQGAVREGLEQLSQAVDRDPANKTVRHQLATVLARLKQYDQAIAHFLRILQLDPRDTDALVGLAGSYAATRQMEEALGCLEEALRIAQSAGNQRLAAEIVKRIDYCRQRMSTGSKP